ncbi:MAG: site-specific integrase [Methylococcaceae bacterium]|nr:site-specific integrase [Methylococcaceae bacterium]
MTPLRQKMLAAMQVRGMSPQTHRSYLSAVTDLAKYYHRSPDQMSGEELQAFFLYLVKKRHLSPATCRLYLNALRFFYLQVLNRDSFGVRLQVPKREQRIPELLMRSEVGQILSVTGNIKHRMMLTTCYGCGLRVSELVKLQIRHIDGERRLLRVEQGKGAKDRAVILSPTLLQLLRDYWRLQRPPHWLFHGSDKMLPLSIAAAQKAFQKAKQRAGVQKIGGIHSLRHAYPSIAETARSPEHPVYLALCALGTRLPGRQYRR